GRRVCAEREGAVGRESGPGERDLREKAEKSPRGAGGFFVGGRGSGGGSCPGPGPSRWGRTAAKLAHVDVAERKQELARQRKKRQPCRYAPIRSEPTHVGDLLSRSLKS